jgi:hypothetical protein
MKIDNIDGISISGMAEKLNLNPKTVRSALRKEGIIPIAYVANLSIYSKAALKVVQERNTRTGRRAKLWQPMEANSASS